MLYHLQHAMCRQLKIYALLKLSLTHGINSFLLIWPIRPRRNLIRFDLPVAHRKTINFINDFKLKQSFKVQIALRFKDLCTARRQSIVHFLNITKEKNMNIYDVFYLLC